MSATSKAYSNRSWPESSRISVGRRLIRFSTDTSQRVNVTRVFAYFDIAFVSRRAAYLPRAD
jgi:hypothetical protein